MKFEADTSRWGIGTYSTRVEQWECDFNGHWNTRYYGLAFDEAAAVCDYLCGGKPGEGELNWHIRFHSELTAAASAKVFSSRVADLKQVHYLTSSSGVSATALRWPIVCGALPATNSEVEARAKPRGLVGGFDWISLDDSSHSEAIALGMMGADQLDSQGRLRMDAMLSCCARGAHLHRESIGIGPDYVKRTGITIILVEKRANLISGHLPGQPLRMISQIGTVSEKSFTSFHLIERYDGATVARIEMCLLAVDINSRKAVPIPDVIRSLTSRI